MSTAITNKVQIGQSPTANNNFVLQTPNVPDGTLEIRRGNAAAPGALVAKINADGGVNTGGAAFSAYANTVQSLPSAAYAKLIFQVEEYDYLGAFDLVNSRFTPTVAGVYLFTGGLRVSAAATLIGALAKNGVVERYLQYVPGSNASSAVYGAASLYLNGTTDYVELFAFQGGAVQNTVAGAVATYFQGHLVRAA